MKSITKGLVGFRLTRFVIVGLLNTVVNFSILNFSFYYLNQSKLVSSFIATTCAVVFSFILNRYFVFEDKGHLGKQIAAFILVTVVGTLVIQNLVYALFTYILHNHELGITNLIYTIAKIKVRSSFVDVNVSNLIASLVVMLWNYNGYRILVFNGKRYGNDIIETDTA